MLTQLSRMMIIMGLATFIFAILCVPPVVPQLRRTYPDYHTSHRIFFPDSPANARFLKPAERVMAVQRINMNQTGVENKRLKREQ